jgi:hypothetical protein
MALLRHSFCPDNTMTQGTHTPFLRKAQKRLANAT